jgi:hypothetical protein
MIAHPIISLQNKGIQFYWTARYEWNFHILEHLLMREPILKIVESNGKSMVCINAHKDKIGGVITQNGHVIIYESRNHKEHERNLFHT